MLAINITILLEVQGLFHSSLPGYTDTVGPAAVFFFYNMWLPATVRDLAGPCEINPCTQGLILNIIFQFNLMGC